MRVSSLALAAIVAVALPVFAQESIGLLAKHRDRLSAELTEGDTDTFAIELSEEGRFSLNVRGDRRSGLLPEILAFPPGDDEPLAIDDALRGVGTSSVRLRRFEPPAGTTGTWRFVLRGADGTTGEYDTKFSVRLPRRAKVRKLDVLPGIPQRVEFTGDDGALASVQVRVRQGEPTSVRLLDPSGSVVDDAVFELAGSKFKLKKFPLSAGFGRYAIEVAADADALVDVKAKVRFERGDRRRETLPPEPVFAVPADPAVRQGAAELVVDLEATDLLPGTTARVSGSGVTVVATEVVSPTLLRLTLDVEDDAPFGPRRLLLFPPETLGEPQSLDGLAVVAAPLPTLTEAELPRLVQGTTLTGVVLRGTGFRAGGSVVASGTGVTVTSLSVVSPTELAISLTAEEDATPGDRALTYTQPVAGGADSTTLSDAFPIHYPDPSLTSSSPGQVRQGTSTTITLDGAGFRPDGSVDLGAGLTIDELRFVDASQLEIEVTVASDAAFGTRTATFQHAAVGGGATATLDPVSTVLAPLPSLTAVSSDTLRQGDDRTFTLTGTGFRDGATVEVTGGGVSPGTVSVVSPTSATVVLTAALDASIGLRDLSYVQPVAGGADRATVSDALRVVFPDPTILAVAPSTLRQATDGVDVTVTGAGFRDGMSAVVSGSGVTVTEVTTGSSTQVTLTLDVDADATLGLRDVTLTHSAAGGGASDTETDAIEVLHPIPTLVSATADTHRQGSSDTTVTVTGTGFRDGGTLTGSTGLTVTDVTVVDAETLTFDLTVADDAPFGDGELTYTQPTAGGGSSVTEELLTIQAPVPTVTDVDTLLLDQGDTQTLTVTGTGFRSGGTLSLSGTGLTLGSTTIVSATEASVSVTAAIDADAGSRTVTYTQPAAGGGDTATDDDAVRVVFPAPQLTALDPDLLRQGDTDVELTLTGDDFRDGMTVTLGDGVTIDSTTVVSATEVTLVVDVADDAAVGDHEVEATHTTAGGGASTDVTGLLTVHHPLPTLTSASPAELRQSGSTTVTLAGSGFRDGGTVTTSREDVTVGTVTIVSDTSLTVALTPASDAAFGDVELTYTQPTAGGGDDVTTTGILDVLAPVPTITARTPATITQGDTGVTLTLTGTGFRDGGAITLSGTGLTLGSTTVSSDTEASVSIDAAIDATIGDRTITYTQPSAGGGDSVAADDALAVVFPTPVISELDPPTIRQDDEGLEVTVFGDGFRTGITASFSGTGITVTDVSVTDAEELVLTLDVASDATVGFRDLTLTQSTAGGGASDTETDAIEVLHPIPTLVSATADTHRQGSSDTTVTVTGTGFRDGGTLTGSTGLTVTDVTVVDAETLTFDLTVADDAPFGDGELTYTQPTAGGGSSVTEALLTIEAPVPTVTEATPFGVTQGETRTVTITGTGFRTGGTLSVSGTGLTLGATTVSSATSASVEVTAAEDATAIPRDLTYTQPASGGGASATNGFIFRVFHPVPIAMSVDTSILRQGEQDVTVVVTGTGFRSVTSAETQVEGVTVESTTFDSTTQLTLVVDVATDADVGLAALRLRQTGTGGGSFSTHPSLFRVNHPAPTLTAASPTEIRQGSGTTVTLTGTGFRDGGSVSTSREDVSVGTVTIVSDTSLTVALTPDSDAAFGDVELTYTQPTAGGGDDVTTTGILDVLAPVPTITARTPATITQGDTGVTLTLTGTGFRDGGAITLSGTALTLGSTTVTSDTEASVSIDAAIDATIGDRTITYTQPAAGGGDAVDAHDPLAVHYPTPTVATASPSIFRQGDDDLEVTVTGTNFRTGMTASVSGTGVSVNSVTLDSATQLTLSVDVAADAAVTGRSLTVTHAAVGGGASATLVKGPIVRHPIPTLTAASPTELRQGVTTTVTFTGSGFRDGGTLTLDALDVTVATVTVVSDTSLTAQLTPDTDAKFGGLDATYTQPAAGGADDVTATGLLDVLAPVPTITARMPATITQGDEGVTLTLTGTGFRDGGAITLSGTGLTLGSTTITSDTEASVNVTAAIDATIGDRTITYTQPAAGGGDSVDADDALAVVFPTPVISELDPPTIRQDDEGVEVTVFGDGFRTGITASFSGTGVTVTDVSVTDAEELVLTLDVDSDADVGLRDLTLTQSTAGGGAADTETDAIEVRYPIPTLTAASPDELRQGTTTSVTFTGSGFRDEGTLSGSPGLSFADVTIVSDTSLTADVTVTSSMTFGAADVTYTQPEVGGQQVPSQVLGLQSIGGGDDSATATGLFTIKAPIPTITDVEAEDGLGTTAFIEQGESRTFIVTGTGFRTGGSLSIGGTGVTIDSFTIDSATEITVTLDAAVDATIDPNVRDLTYSQPAAGGGDSTTAEGAIRVVYPPPCITTVFEPLRQGATDASVTLEGFGFRPGMTLSIVGGGITVESITVVDDGEITVVLDVDDDATVGNRRAGLLHSTQGGGSSCANDRIFTVKHPIPTLTAASPTEIRQGSATTVTLTGSGFRDGGTVTTSREDVTVGTVTIVSDTSLTVALTPDSDAAFGDVELTYTQPTAGGGDDVTTTGILDVLAPVPTITARTPATITQGDEGVTLTLTGTGFRDGGAITLSGTGLTLGSTTITSDTQASVNVTAAIDATVGDRTITYTQPAAGGGDSVDADDALAVVFPAPVISELDPPTIRQDDEGVEVTVFGENFRTGITASFSGTGITVTDVSLTDAEELVLTLDVASDADVGFRDLTLTQASSGGGASETETDAIEVRYPIPTLTAASPDELRQGTTTSVTFTGSGFRDDGTLSGSFGLSFADVTVVSDTSLTADVTVTSNMAFGAADVTYTQPFVGGQDVPSQVLGFQAIGGGGGDDSATATGLFTIKAPIPTVTEIDADVVIQGDEIATFTVTGTGFRSGGVISIEGTGLTVGATTFVSETSATVSIEADDDAAFGPRDVTWTQPAAGGSDTGTLTDGLAVHAPTPSIGEASGGVVQQGDTGATVTVFGSNFRSGGTVTLPTGITLNSLTFETTERIVLDVDVADDAPLGSQDLTYTQPALGGGASDTESIFVVEAPTPTVTAVSPTEVEQGQESVELTVTGTGFRSGGELSVSGRGLTLGATTIDSATQARVTIDVDTDAIVGSRDVTFTQSESGGGHAGTGSELLAIHYPDPTLTSVTPDEVVQGTSGSFTLTGTGFRSNGTVSISGTGVTLGGKEGDATSIVISYTVAAGATVGERDITYTQDSEGGGASATLTDATDVVRASPTFTSITPDSLPPGSTRRSLTVAGADFRSGITASFSGSGITVHSTTLESSTELTLDVSVASNATLGNRDVVLTPSDASATTAEDAFHVRPAAPVVRALDKVAIARSATNVALTVEGENFESGDTVSVSGTGVTVSGVTVVDTRKITATLAVASGASTGPRDLTVTHSDANGGAVGTLSGAITITSATPSVTSCNPAKLGRTGTGGPTRTAWVEVTGTNFMSGATVALSLTQGSGLTVVSGTTSVISDTRLRFQASVAATTTAASWDVRVTNPGTLGNSGTSGNGALQVVSETTLAINRVIDSTGPAYGGNRVTIEGSGFTAGVQVDFETVRAAGVQRIDQNTLILTVPQPRNTSSTGPTAVDVKVTQSGSTETLADGYEYDRDHGEFQVVSTFPAQGATNVPGSLRMVCVRVSEPADTSTGTHGSTTGTNSFWFQQGGSLTSASRSFGPRDRWVVIKRSTTSGLATGTYVIDVPTALQSKGGNALVPQRLARTENNDQYTFGIGTGTDTTAPTIATSTPTNAATGVSPMTRVIIGFSEEIDPTTATATNLALTFIPVGSQVPTTVATDIELAPDLKTVRLTPFAELPPSTQFTLTVTGVTDLHGNTIARATRTFTTSGTDTTNPVVNAVTIERLPSDLDGSGTYVNSSGTTGQAFDVFLPKFGFELVVELSDAGGAGIDASTFSAKCSVAVGSNAANTELASLFDVTPTRAVWRPDSGNAISTGDDVTFTFNVKDTANNTSSNKVITIDVVDRDAAATATTQTSGGDLDPFDSRRTWVLRTDLDAYSATFSTAGNGDLSVTTTRASNGVADFYESLQVAGLHSTNMTTAAAATVNGSDVGTNAIIARLFAERVRELVRERFDIDADGTYGPDSPDVEFILPGERGSLSSYPTYSTTSNGSSTAAFSEMSLSGTRDAESNGTTAGNTLGQAFFDPRDRGEQANVNTTSGTLTGVYLLTMFKLQVNGSGTFGTVVSAKLVSQHGGTPVGEDASDDDVLAGTFDRTTSTNTTHNARYDEIMDALELCALYASSVTAHEIGHSVGLVPDGPPKTGLFGNAHHSNTFTDATSTVPNTSGHLDYLGADLMSASTSFDKSVRTGIDFARFSPMDIAYLLGRLVQDEGK